MKSIHEILDRLKNSKDRKKEAKYFIESSQMFRDMVELAHNPFIKWTLPDGSPYDSDEKDAAVKYLTRHDQTSDQRKSFFLKNYKTLLNFTNLGKRPANNLEHESNFQRFISNLNPEDAEIILYMKVKRSFPVRGLNKKFFEDINSEMRKRWNAT